MTDFSSLRDPARPASPDAPAALNGRELAELLSPVSCEDFVGRYFARQSLHVKGHAGKFDHIFSMERLRLALAEIRRHDLHHQYSHGRSLPGPLGPGDPRATQLYRHSWGQLLCLPRRRRIAHAL